MRLLLLFAFVTSAVLLVKASHTFLGTNVRRPGVFHQRVRHGAKVFQKRVEEFKFSVPPLYNQIRVIQGILAYDLTDTEASANVTAGGLGANYLTLRMKSARGKSLDYDIYIYV